LEKAFEIKRFGLDIAQENLTKRHLEIALRTAHPVQRTIPIFRLVHPVAPH
jgi:hypothetical protein